MIARSADSPTGRIDSLRPWGWRLPILALITLFFVLRIPLIEHRAFDPDELEHVHVAFCISDGMLPYKDFFELHTPWLQGALSGLFPIFGTSLTTLFAARWLMLSITALIVYLTYRLGRELYGANVGLLAALLLSGIRMFVDKTIEIRPDVPAAACWLAGLIAFIRGTRDDAPRWLGLAGLAFGSALMFTLKVGFGLAGVLVALLWVHIDYRFLEPGNRRVRGTLLFLAGLAAPLLATLVYFWARGGLESFIECNFILTSQWARQFSPHRIIRRFIEQSPEVAALGAAGWIGAAIALRKWSVVQRGGVVPVMAAAGLFIGQFLVPVPYRQYYQPLLPLWALFGAALLWKLFDAPPLSLRERWADPPRRTALLLWVIALGLSAWALGATLWSTKPELGGSAARYAWMWGLLGAASLGSLMPARWARGAACCLLVAAAYLLTPLRALGASFLVPACAVSALAFVLDTRLLAALVLSVGLAARPVQQMRGALEERNDPQLEGIEYVMSLTTPEDKVFTGWSGMGVFRRHAYYYYFLHPEVRAWMTIQEMTDGPLRALRTERPKVVEYDLHVRALPQPVQDYIRENYVPTRLDYVWVRRDAVDAERMSQR